MDRKERFNEAYGFLFDNGYFHNQKEAAEKMGTTSPNMSSALKGKDHVLTDNFLKRFSDSFPAISIDWLLSESGSMLTLENNTSGAKDNNELEKLKEENASLLKEIERLRKENDSLRSEIVGMERMAKAFGINVPDNQIEEKRNVG